MKLVLRICLWLVLAFAVVGFVGVTFATYVVSKKFEAARRNLPDLATLKERKPFLTMRFYDRNGYLLAEIGDEKRDLITYDELPQLYVDAILATEDVGFFSHADGLSKKALFRAGRDLGMKKLGFNWRVSGGSTIDMQTIKNIFFMHEGRGLERKIKEIILAPELNKLFTKKEIFELYVNTIYYGRQIYGIKSAARHFFNKEPKDLTLSEIAVLVRIPQHPEGDKSNDPRSHPDIAQRAKIVVLKRLVDVGKISEAEAIAAINEPINVARDANPYYGAAPAMVALEMQRLEKQYGKEAVAKLGWNITLTVDGPLNAFAQELLDSALEKIGKTDHPQGSVVMSDPATGEILAMVGGTKFKYGDFNRAVYARRQAGSTWKLIDYAALMEAGQIDPLTVYENTEVSFNDHGRVWKPGNYEGEFADVPTFNVLDAFAHSLNTVAVKAVCGLKPGVPTANLSIDDCKRDGYLQQVVDLARNLGIKVDKQTLANLNPSLALGTGTVTPMQMLGAYATFANRGVYIEPTIVKRIDGQGAPALNAPGTRAVVSQRTVGLMIQLLEAVIEDGTGRSAKNAFGSYQAYGKTGTTSDFTDAWFDGFTARFALVVHIGFDNPKNKLGKGHTGASDALPIWKKMMARALGTPGLGSFDDLPSSDTDRITVEDLPPINVISEATSGTDEPAPSQAESPAEDSQPPAGENEQPQDPDETEKPSE